MKRKSLGKWIGVFALAGTAGLLLSVPSCARNQRLVGITIQPSGFTFLTPNPQSVGIFTALGTYIHPPETKDITNLVTWKSDVQGLLTINAGSVSPVANTCGIANISASYNKGTAPDGNLVIGYATVTVDNSQVAGCPSSGSGPILDVLIPQSTTTGNSVVSNPTGIDCPATSCGATFASGTVVTLTASPSSNFLSWTGCTGTANVCQVTVSGNMNVTANFR